MNMDLSLYSMYCVLPFLRRLNCTLGSLGGSLMTYPLLYFIYGIEEGRAASKSPHYKFGCFLSMCQQAVSADTMPNSAVGIFFPKNRRNKEKGS
jgi:hypothetical protein